MLTTPSIENHIEKQRTAGFFVTARPQDTTLDPSAAVSPNIFDVLCNSTLIAPILLANLLSADLWLLSEKIRSKYSPSKGALEAAPAPIPAVDVGEEGLSKALRAIQRQVDRGFKHVHPNEIAEIYGYLDIRTERRRLGDEQLNTTLDKLQQAFKERAALGEQQATLTNVILNDISHERFPAYIYQNYDLVHARV